MGHLVKRLGTCTINPLQIPCRVHPVQETLLQGLPPNTVVFKTGESGNSENEQPCVFAAHGPGKAPGMVIVMGFVRGVTLK